MEKVEMSAERALILGHEPVVADDREE